MSYDPTMTCVCMTCVCMTCVCMTCVCMVSSSKFTYVYVCECTYVHTFIKYTSHVHVCIHTCIFIRMYRQNADAPYSRGRQQHPAPCQLRCQQLAAPSPSPVCVHMCVVCVFASVGSSGTIWWHLIHLIMYSTNTIWWHLIHLIHHIMYSTNTINKYQFFERRGTL